LYSAPLTVFGPLLCVFYAGSHYMAFRDRDRIEIFTRHFDRLVREASLTARQLPDHLRSERTRIAG
ncbi:transcriptional regulator, partial [Cribrihabitans sp. XS_ASV171]